MQDSKQIYKALKDQFVESYYEILESFAEYVPSLLVSAALLLFGFFCARALEVMTNRLINKIDLALYANSDGLSRDKRHQNIKKYYSLILSKTVFWVVILFFLLTIANVLDFKIFSEWTSSLVSYIPILVSGMVIILGGFIVSNIAYNAVLTSTKSSHISKGNVPARGAQIIIIFTTTIIGLEHIGINSYLLNNILIVMIGTLFLGMGLAFSLGAKDLVANIIGAQYARKHYRIGQNFIIGRRSGTILEINHTSIILKSDSGITTIPAKLFSTKISTLLLEEKGDAE